MEKAPVKPDVVNLVIRWVARVWGIISLGFMLLMVGGEIITPTAPPPSEPRDLLAMVFFPVGVCAGLVLAWWREGLGGAITVGSMLAFYFILWAFDGRFPRGPYFALVAGPGILFLLLWAIALVSHKASSANPEPGAGSQ